MADKGIVDKIKQRERDRPRGLLDAFGSIMAAQQNYSAEAEREAVTAGLEFLVTDLREVAEMYIEAKLRGGKASADNCRAAAAKLQLLVIELRKGADREAPKRLPVEWCGQHHEHNPHDWPEHEPTRNCSGYTVKSMDRLKALVAERAAAADQPLEEGGPESMFIDPPAWIDEFEPAPAQSEQAAVELDHGDDAWAYTSTREQQAINGFTDPVGPGARPVPGDRATWETLGDALTHFRRGPETAMASYALPEHLSHSQIETLEDCGTKYLLQRSGMLGVVQVPQWAFIGGNAFHTAIERFELLAAEVKTATFVRDRLNVAELWKGAFTETVTQAALDNPLMPMDTWRASKQGREGYTWWLVNGEDMVGKYTAARLAELEQQWRMIRYSSPAPSVPQCPECGCADGEPSMCTDLWHIRAARPMIEYPFEMDVEGVRFRGIIDQVWDVVADHGPMRAGDLLIDDAKAGAKVPGETGQLGEYALWLSRFGGGQDRTIWGRFYDARKGAWSEPIDLLGRHGWDRFSYEVQAADQRKRSGLFTPRPSSYCNGCSVKHACPIFATAGA